MPRPTLLQRLAALLSIVFLLPTLAPAQESIEERTRGMEERDGYFPLYWDADEGRLHMEIPRFGEEFYYLVSQATGIGSNRLGLDRGEIMDEYIARFDRNGPKVLFVLTNPRFRNTDEDHETLTRSVEESFPTSVVAAWEVEATSGDRVLVDVTDYFLDDVAGLGAALRARGQGSFRADRERSTFHHPHTKAFPENTEIEASITLAADDPGGEVRAHTPDGRSLTLREHHSLVKLPPPGYEPRELDPRIGLFPITFFDYSNPLEEGYQERLAARHRLIKEDPDAEISEPVEPIVYYLDPAVPEPYRSAFEEGLAWYGEVFEAAGFRNAFQVKDMPPGMDPLDARYNVIQWVHRTEAGSSIGPSFRDPRTGEVIKAAVRMDSHRSLVDYNLYAGARPAAGGYGGGAPGAAVPSDQAPWWADLLGTAEDPFLGSGAELDWVASLDPDVSGEEFAMARRRQHAAHEIGHTLGLAHNFIAVSYGRASVMDYPAPLVKLDANGEIDLSDAYRPSAGAYDSLAIRWAYTQFPEGEEEEGLEAIVQEAMDRGLEFISNPYEGAWSSYPEATTWVNGAEPLAELERVMEVRRVLIDRFDETAIRPGMAMWRLNERFVPVYLHHRFSLTAAIKAVGGMEFRYAHRGDPLPPTKLVAPERQRRALELVLEALAPEELAVPERILEMMAPRPFGYAPDRRAFDSDAAPAFDQVGIARTLAEMVVGRLLIPNRVARVVAFNDRDPEMPALEEVLGTLIEGTWGAPRSGEHPVPRRVVERVVVDELIGLASDDDATVEARAGAEWGLRRIAERIEARMDGAGPADESERAHMELAHADIRRFLRRTADPVPALEPLDPPPGTPIGDPPPRR